MKRITTFLASAALFCAAISAQSFSFYQSGTALANGAEITAATAIDDGFGGITIESHLALKNNTNADVEATMTQTLITAPLAGTLSFCYGSCMNGNENRSETNMVASGFMDGFHLCFYPIANVYVSTKVLYEIYPVDNPADKTTLTVTYVYSESSGLTDIQESDVMVHPNGNAVHVSCSFSTATEREFVVYNTLGKPVANYTINKAQDDFCFYLKDGLYIYAVTENNKPVLSKKIIIR